MIWRDADRDADAWEREEWDALADEPFRVAYVRAVLGLMLWSLVNALWSILNWRR
mgnify:CR=1 FL=1